MMNDNEYFDKKPSSLFYAEKMVHEMGRIFKKTVLAHCKTEDKTKLSCAMLADIVNMGQHRKFGKEYNLDNGELSKLLKERNDANKTDRKSTLGVKDER